MRRAMAIAGGVLAGLGLAGAGAALIGMLGLNQDGSTAPIIAAGLSLGLGVGLLVAACLGGSSSGAGRTKA